MTSIDIAPDGEAITIRGSGFEIALTRNGTRTHARLADGGSDAAQTLHPTTVSQMVRRGRQGVRQAELFDGPAPAGEIAVSQPRQRGRALRVAASIPGPAGQQRAHHAELTEAQAGALQNAIDHMAARCAAAETPRPGPGGPMT